MDHGVVAGDTVLEPLMSAGHPVISNVCVVFAQTTAALDCNRSNRSWVFVEGACQGDESIS